MANIKFTQLPNLGNITPTTIVPVVSANINYSVTAANLQTYVNSTTGNITANYFIGNGSALTGLPATYGNSNVAAYLPTFLPTYTGNLTANVISATGNITASYIIGDGSQITNLPAGNYSNANVAAYLPVYTGNITSVVEVTATGNLTGSNILTAGVVSAGGNVRGSNINTVGNVSATGNITGNYYVGNGSQLTGIVSSYGNSNVQQVLQTYSGTLTAGSVSAIGNITGNYLIGNGALITGINVATTYGNSNVATYLASGTNTSNIITTGNVQGSFVKGNGSALTGLVSSIVAGNGIAISGATGAVTITNNNPNPYTNANVAAYLPTYTGNITAGNISTTGTITGTHAGNGAGLSNIVTSISAGSGISVNAATGAVTITATGGGGGGNSFIANGTSNVTVVSSGGNIEAWANGIRQMRILTSNASAGFTPVIVTGLSVSANASITGNLGVAGTTGVGDFTSSGLASFTNSQFTNGPSLFGGANCSSGTFTISAGAIFNESPRTKTGTSTGTAGDIAWDANYIYVCTATNVWKRVALVAF